MPPARLAGFGVLEELGRQAKGELAPTVSESSHQRLHAWERMELPIVESSHAARLRG
jgi:hypothetical protein